MINEQSPRAACSYTVEPLGHAYPAQCPARVLLSRVPLGPLPWLHRLRARAPRFVRRLQCYYEEVRLLTRASSASTPRLPDADRSKTAKAAKQEISRFPCKECTYMPVSKTTQGRAGTRSNAPVRVAFRYANSVDTLN